jgi:endonuclease YncB( thermonuclease family)
MRRCSYVSRVLQLRSLGTWSLAVLAYLAALAAVSPTVRQRLPLHREMAPPDGTWARVTDVVDGDTITVEGGESVRVLGLDAPETGNPNMDGAQPLGFAASRRLRELLLGREVVLERDASDRDHYGRRLRHVWCGGELVAEVLVAEGLAYAMSIPPNTRYAARLRAAGVREFQSEKNRAYS